MYVDTRDALRQALLQGMGRCGAGSSDEVTNYRCGSELGFGQAQAHLCSVLADMTLKCKPQQQKPQQLLIWYRGGLLIQGFSGW